MRIGITTPVKNPMWAAHAGADLARYMRAVEKGGADPDHYARLVQRLMHAPCTNSADALALLSWAVVTLPMVLEAIPDGDSETEFARSLLTQSFALVHGATFGLVQETGIPMEAFTGTAQPAN